MFRIPQCTTRRKEWLQSLNLEESHVKEHHRVCSRHFPSGDQTQKPSLALGPRFCSPKKVDTARGKRALKRKALSPSLFTPPSKRSGRDNSISEELSTTSLSVQASEQLLSSSDYSIYELPQLETDDSIVSSVVEERDDTQVIVSKALLSRIEFLEGKNKQLQSQLQSHKPKVFRLETISHDDGLVQFYTGFISFELLLAFFHFLGPAVDNLHYWELKAEERVEK